MLSASAEQIGIASRMRDRVRGKDRRMLNYVVHSPCPDPRHGKNPYAACNGYDPDVTKLLKDVAQRHALPTNDVDFVELLHEIKDLLRSINTTDVDDLLIEIKELLHLTKREHTPLQF